MLRVVPACRACGPDRPLNIEVQKIMLQIPVDLALDFVRQLIATQLGSQPTGPPITLAEIRERTGAKKTTSDLALKRAVLRVAFERIRAA